MKYYLFCTHGHTHEQKLQEIFFPPRVIQFDSFLLPHISNIGPIHLQQIARYATDFRHC